LGDRDPDLREMACRDLEKNMQGELKLTPSEELSLVNKFLDMMSKDQTLKVLAAHTLVDLLAKSATPANIQTAATTSTQLLLGKHSEDEKTIFEVSTYVLKGLASSGGSPSFPPHLVFEPIIESLKSKGSQVVEYGLDVIEGLLVNWGSHLTQENRSNVYADIQTATVPFLKSKVYNIQTKAIGCVGNVSAFLSYDAFGSLFSQLVQNLAHETEASVVCTTLASLSTICRLSPTRISQYLPPLIELLNKFLQSSNFPEEADQVKVWEASLILYETVVLHCPTTATSSHLETILNDSLTAISYDPTVIEGEEEEEPVDEVEYDNEDEGVADESETWRVRKASIKALAAISGKWHDGPLSFLDLVGEELLKRFTDNQVNVKIEAFKSFGTIVNFVKNAIKEGEDVKRFLDWVPDYIVHKRLVAEFKGSSDKSKIEAYALVQEISTVTQGVFSNAAIKDLTPGLIRSLKDKSENLRAAAAKALASVIQSTADYSVLQANIKDLSEALIITIATPNFKVTATALRTAAFLSKVIPQSNEIIKKIYNTLYGILTQDGAALEVKEAVISTVGQVISTHGAFIKEVSPAVKVLGDRLSHATTCVAAAKAIQTIASSNVALDPAQPGVLVQQLVDSLKLNNRQVRQASLEALITVVSALKVHLPHLEVIVTHIEPEDLLLTNLALRLVAAALKADKSIVPSVKSVVVPKLATIVRNPALQGGAVQSLGLVLQSVVEQSPDSYAELIKTFHFKVVSPGQEAQSAAQALASITLGTGKHKEFTSQILADAKGGNPLAISALGEIGARDDIINPELLSIIKKNIFSLSSSGPGDKSIRFLAARALGSVLVSQVKLVREAVKDLVESSPQFVVVVVRQVIDRLSVQAVEGHTKEFVDILLQVTKSEAALESAAECLAKLIQLNHDVVKAVAVEAKSEAKNRRVCVIRAVNIAVNQSSEPEIFKASLPLYLEAITDKEVDVRTAALGLALTAVTKGLKLPQTVIPHVFTETKRNPVLITKMVVGSSTLVTDLGLPSRRAAFQILEVVLATSPEVLNVAEVVAALGLGSKSDEEVEIQMFSHKLAAKVIQAYPDVAIKGMAAFDISPVFVKTLPNTAIEVDIKANEELVASARQVVVAMESVFFTHKYVSNKETVALLETFVKSFFGGLKAGKFYTEVLAGLAQQSTKDVSLKALTEFFKSFDTKLQNNIGHKPIAEDVLSGMEEVISSPTFKNIQSNKEDAFVKSVLALIKVLDVAFLRLEKHKADMKVPPHAGFQTYLNTVIKKGPLASKYAEIK